MTLTRQIIGIFIVGLLILFLSTFSMSLYFVKSFYEQQLNNNAQDTATALGITLSKTWNGTEDKSQILAQVKAVFDQGYFHSIDVTNTSNQLLVSRVKKINEKNVPFWFRLLLPIETHEQKSLVMQHWNQVGFVKVISDSELAYLALWKSAKMMFIVYFSVTILLLLIGIAILKYILNPLKSIIRQAHDIGRKNFYTLNIPIRTKELKKLSNSINIMVKRLQKLFDEQLNDIEKYRRKAYIDNLTQIGNRRYFFQSLESFLSSTDIYKPSHLVLIEVVGLEKINQSTGYYEGDKVLNNFAKMLKDSLPQKQTLMLSRIDGPEFAFIIQQTSKNNLEIILSTLVSHLNIKDLNKFLSINICATVTKFNEDVSNLMKSADENLFLARNNPHGIYIASINPLATNNISNTYITKIFKKKILHYIFNLLNQVNLLIIMKYIPN